MVEKITIDASTIREGGGLVLLRYIIEQLECSKLDYEVIGNTFIADRISSSRNIKKINISYIFLLYIRGVDRCLYFCNRAPLICKESSYVYIQTPYLTYLPTEILKLKIPISRKIKHLFNLYTNKIASLNRNHKIIVQTESMKKGLSRNGLKSEIMPIFPVDRVVKKKYKTLWDFCYISYPWPHKNHKLILDSMLSSKVKSGFRLALTIPEDDRFSDLHVLIQEVNKLGVFKVTNLGVLPKGKVNEVYSKSKALLFVSSKESFGLPLIEAAQIGLPIFAPDLDYVNDIIDNVYHVSLDDPIEFLDRLIQCSITDLEKPKLKVQDQVEKLIAKLCMNETKL